ncbi:MAG: COR domain-containing protein, partial [Cyanobacteria bacterium P01_A01_bin.137]
LPGSWAKVRSVLENYGQNCNHITVEEYFELCQIQGFADRSQMLSISGYLHDLGVCLHFQEDKLLKKTVILKPEWGTTAVYQVFDNKKVQENLGHFTDGDLQEIWIEDQYADMRDELLQLMMKFKLCYEIPNNEGAYIAPSLLSINQPDYSWDGSDNLILRFEYGFMPKGILTRFIVEMHEQIEESLVWKNGVVVANHWARAEVIEHYRYHKGEIRIRVSGKNKKSLLSVVIHELEKIHASYERLQYKAFIPCNCKDCNGSQSPHDYAFEVLLQFMNDGQSTIQCQKSYQMVNVRRLIDDVVTPPPLFPEPGKYETAKDHKDRRNYDEDTISLEQMNNTMAMQPMMGRMPDQIFDAVRSPVQGINLFFPFNISQEVPMGNTYQFGKGDNFGGDRVMGDKIGTQINNNQDLAQAAQDIKTLLDQLSEDYDPSSPVGQAMINAKAIETVSKNNTLKKRVVKALKSAGDEALEQAIQHPVAKVFVAGAKSFIEG